MLTKRLRVLTDSAQGKDKTRLEKAANAFCSNPSIVRALCCHNSVLSEPELDAALEALNLPAGYEERFKAAFLQEVDRNNKSGVELTVHGQADAAQARKSLTKSMEALYGNISVR